MGFKKVHKVDGVIPFRFRDSLESSNYMGGLLECRLGQYWHRDGIKH